MTTTSPHVTVLRWPGERALRDALRARRVARLLVVEAGQHPPTDIDVLEDWASSTADAAELEARLAALEARATRASEVPTIGEDDDVVRFAGRWIALGTVEASIARVLIEHLGQLVSRSTIETVAWGDRSVRANTTDRQLHRLRRHLGDIGLTLHTVRGKGYVLEVAT
ncbi:MAG: two-component system, OmpR family, response regulator [Actinomycetota bacterium]|nr:two-component system, OmpR family, response regulator [Actinomycetota bacterium]